MKATKGLKVLNSSNKDVIGGPVDGATTSVIKPEKAGYLYTVPSKTFLSREKWKRRYFALQGSKLYRFHKKEDARIDSHSTKCRFIGLESYDVCLPDKDNDNFKRENVFLLVASEIITSEKMRYVFSTDDEEELEDWIAYLRRAVSRTREGRRPQRPPRTRALSPSTRNERPSSEDNSISGRLYNPNKYRVRGPKGRRLPQKKYRQTIDVTERFRSSSLCELDMEDEDCVDMDEGKVRRDSSEMADPVEPFEGQSKLNDRIKSNSIGDLAYQYSSSEEGLSKSKDKLQNSETADVDHGTNGHNSEKEVAAAPQDAPADKCDGYTARDRYLSCSPSDGMDFFAQLAARLTEMTGSLTRFRTEVLVELGFLRECISLTSETTTPKDNDKKLVQHPTVTTTDLKGTEGELEELANIMDKVATSLQILLSHCKDELAKTSDL